MDWSMENWLNILSVITAICGIIILISNNPFKEFENKRIKIISFISAVVVIFIALISHLITNEINEPNRIFIEKVEKGRYDKNDGYYYTIKFNTVKNKPLNEINIELEIEKESEAIFKRVSGNTVYSSNVYYLFDKKLTYYFSMIAGRNPEIGFSVSIPTEIIISGNYSLETKTIKLPTH